jgi:tRNA(Ile)-lysidine synthetase-like protein
MIKLLGKLPLNPVIALSGGVDSMAVADFVSRSRSVQCAFFHHGTGVSDIAHKVVREYCDRRGWQLFEGHIVNERPEDLSPEEHWRNERYAFLDNLQRDVITGHHLDDSVETYLWSTLHGTAKVIPYRRNRVIRPFSLAKKADLEAWAERHTVPWTEDYTNGDTKYMRNYVRHNIVPHALAVNPGLHKVVARKVEEQYHKTLDTNY